MQLQGYYRFMLTNNCPQMPLLKNYQRRLLLPIYAFFAYASCFFTLKVELFFPSIVHYHTVFAFFFLALENFSPIFAKSWDKMGKNFPRFSQKLGENGKKFPPFLKKQGENGKKFPQGKFFPFSPNFFINANTLILKADKFYLSRQNQRLSRLKYCKGTS